MWFSRFNYSSSGSKNDDPVLVPFDGLLDLSPLSEEEVVVGASSPSPITNGTSASSSTSTYELRGSVRHMGSLSSGHYISYCRVNTGTAGKEQVLFTLEASVVLKFPTRFECIFRSLSLMMSVFV